MPENSQAFYSQLIELISFDPFPDTDSFYEKYFKMEKGDPFSDEAESVGYESNVMVFNSGSVFIFTVIMIAN